MELAFLVYVISLLSGFTYFFIAIGIFSILFLIVSCMCLSFWIDDSFSFIRRDKDGNLEPRYQKKADFHTKNIKNSIIAAIFSILIAVLIPSEKTAYLMVGAYATQKIATDPRSVEIGGKVLTLINQKLDKFIDEGMEKTSKKVDKVIDKAVDTAASKLSEDKK